MLGVAGEMGTLNGGSLRNPAPVGPVDLVDGCPIKKSNYFVAFYCDIHSCPPGAGFLRPTVSSEYSE